MPICLIGVAMTVLSVACLLLIPRAPTDPTNVTASNRNGAIGVISKSKPPSGRPTESQHASVPQPGSWRRDLIGFQQ